ncbi:MAG: LLM class flavin-dependent oxidoreductase [Candidatus Bathyarchaeota archaeon]|nr:MAG: LLM class flavin-dependent oxidoreductase [Candidatus Bathyarchaeota archaeon]
MRSSLPAQIKFGYESAPYPWQTINELAIYVEQQGFDSFWMPDHTVGFGIRRWDALEAWTVLSAIASKTKSLLLGTCVSDTYRHHPAVLAQMAATCDIISHGRAILGVGIGEAMNLNPYGIQWNRPVSRTIEALKIIKRLWTENVVDHEGKFYRLKQAFLQPKPFQKPHVPIFVAGNSPRTMKMAAEYGDGWVPASMQPSEYEEKLRYLFQTASKAGRFWDGLGWDNPPEIEPALFIYVVIAKDFDTARKLVLLPAKLYLLSRPRIIQQLGYHVPTTKFEMTSSLVFNPEVSRNLLKVAQEIPDEVVDKSPIIFGSPDDVIERIEKYVHAGVRHFISPFFVSQKLMKMTCQLFAEKVIAYFRKGK